MKEQKEEHIIRTVKINSPILFSDTLSSEDMVFHCDASINLWNLLNHQLLQDYQKLNLVDLDKKIRSCKL